jgi:hypothetical protein
MDCDGLAGGRSAAKPIPVKRTTAARTNNAWPAKFLRVLRLDIAIKILKF